MTGATDLVVISLEPWDEVWRRNQHLVSGLLRTGRVERVLFVAPPVDRLHAVRRRQNPFADGTGLQPVADTGSPSRGRIWQLRLGKNLPRRIDPGGDRRRASRVCRAADSLAMTCPLLWINDPGGVEVLNATGWPAVYDITDDWLVADRPAPELERLQRQEKSLLHQCAEAVVCSPALRDTKSAQREVRLIPNAVDLTPYRQRQSRPADLPTGPVAVYLGTAHRDRLDVDLCRTTAQRLAAADPPGTVVLVGPAPLPDADVSALRHAGVVLLGPRPSHLVPEYLQHADALLVPHVITRFTSSLDPIKAYEYRAARRPVVATEVPGFADASDALVQAVSADAFPDAVAAALAAQVPWGSELPDDIPDWTDRAAAMAGVLDRVAEGNPRD